MNAHKLFFPKSKTKSHIILLKQICNTAKNSETSLYKRYKNNYFTSCRQKTAIALATNMKRAYFAVL